MNTEKIISMAIVLIILSVVLPIGLVYISGAGDVIVSWNGTTTTLTEVADPTVVTLLEVLVPILVVVSVLMYFIGQAKMKKAS